MRDFLRALLAMGCWFIGAFMFIAATPHELPDSLRPLLAVDLLVGVWIGLSTFAVMHSRPSPPVSARFVRWSAIVAAAVGFLATGVMCARQKLAIDLQQRWMEETRRSAGEDRPATNNAPSKRQE